MMMTSNRLQSDKPTSFGIWYRIGNLQDKSTHKMELTRQSFFSSLSSGTQSLRQKPMNSAFSCATLKFILIILWVKFG